MIGMGSPAWTAAGWTMLHLIWIGAAIAALGFALRWALRTSRPEVRYGASLACLALLSVAPFALFARLYEPSTVVSAVATSSENRASDQKREARPEASFPRIPHERPRAWSTPDLGGIAPASSRWESVVVRLPWLWIAGSSFTLILLATGLVGVRRLKRSSRVLFDGDAAKIAQRLADSIGLARRFGLAVCDRITSPVLIGIVRPMILLPASALSGWSAEELEMALLHELAHLRRHDNLINLIQCVIEAILFFHPATWWLSAWVRLEREHCCDALVVEQTGRSRPYAEMLAALAGSGHPRMVSAMSERPVISRIRKILNMEERPMRLTMREGFGLIAAALVAGGMALGAYGRDDPKPDDKRADELKSTLRAIAAKASGVSFDTPAEDDQANALMTIAREQFEVGDLDAAKKTIAQAEKLMTKDAEASKTSNSFESLIAVISISELWRDLGEPDKARATLDRATKALQASNPIKAKAGAPDEPAEASEDMMYSERAWRIANERIKLGDKEEARRILRGAIDRTKQFKGKSRPLYLGILGANLVTAGDKEGGLALLAQAERETRVQTADRCYLAGSFAEAGDLDTAFKLVDEQDPEQREPGLIRVVEAFAEGDENDPFGMLVPSGIKILIGARGLKAKGPESALAYLSERMRKYADPKVKARILSMIAVIQAKAGDFPGAIAAADAIPAISKGKDDGPSDGFYDSVKPCTFAMIAAKIAAKGDKVRAAEAFDRAASLTRDIKDDGEKVVAMIVLADSLADSKDNLMAMGTVREAAELAKTLSEPRRSRSLSMLVGIQAKAGDPSGAVALVDAMRPYPGEEKAQGLTGLAYSFNKAGDEATAKAMARMVLECVKVEKPEGFKLGPELKINAFGRDTFIDPDLEFGEGWMKFDLKQIADNARNMIGDVAESENAARAMPIVKQKGVMGGRWMALGVLACNLASKGQLDEAMRVAETIESPHDRLWTYQQMARGVRYAAKH